ncbi:MAG: glycerophosphodiester phosphodiesterase [Litorilinea sp.]
MSTVKTWEEFYTTRAERARPLVVAHRGVPVLKPENTLDSFALALDQAADVLETDLRLTQDGEIVLFHDATLERMTDGIGELGALTLDQVKKLRTRTPSGALSGQSVPTLVDLLQLTQGQVPLLLELKDARFAEVTVAQRLIDTLQAHDVLARTSIVSFKPELVSSVNAVETSLPVGHLSLNELWPRRDMPLLGPYWPLLYMNPTYVWWAHRQGSIVAPLDPIPEARLGYYLRLGVDALLADYPARVMRALEKRMGI